MARVRVSARSLRARGKARGEGHGGPLILLAARICRSRHRGSPRCRGVSPALSCGVSCQRSTMASLCRTSSRFESFTPCSLRMAMRMIAPLSHAVWMQASFAFGHPSERRRNCLDEASVQRSDASSEVERIDGPCLSGCNHVLDTALRSAFARRVARSSSSPASTPSLEALPTTTIPLFLGPKIPLHAVLLEPVLRAHVVTVVTGGIRASVIIETGMSRPSRVSRASRPHERSREMVPPLALVVTKMLGNSPSVATRTIDPASSGEDAILDSGQLSRGRRILDRGQDVGEESAMVAPPHPPAPTGCARRVKRPPARRTRR